MGNGHAAMEEDELTCLRPLMSYCMNFTEHSP